MKPTNYRRLALLLSLLLALPFCEVRNQAEETVSVRTEYEGAQQVRRFNFCQSKIKYSHLLTDGAAVRNHDVQRFEITMDYAVRVSRAHG